MFIPNKKIYGRSRIDNCPFCDKQAIIKSKEGIPVCKDHKEESLPIQKCACGEPLELRTGKFGPYFFCMRCGNINFRKGLEFGTEPKETTVCSDEI